MHLGTEEILHRIDDGVILTDRNKTIGFVNEAFLRLFAVEREQVIGARCYDICHQCPVRGTKRYSSPAASCTLAESFQHGRPQTIRYRHVLPNGETRVFQISASPLLDAEGTTTHLFQIFKDITPQEELREQAEKNHRELRQIFDNAPFCIIFMDKEMRVVRVNPAMETLIGMKSETLVGRYCYDCWGQYATDATRTGREKLCDNCQVERSLADGQSHVFIKRNGSRVIEVVANPVRDAQGAIVGAMEFGNDITEQYQAAEALRQSEKRYRVLFENSPTIICLADFSAIKQDLDNLRRQGCTDLPAFFVANPEVLRACLSRLRIIEINQAAVQVFGASSQQEVIDGLSKIIGPETFFQTVAGLVAIGRGDASFAHEITTYRLTGGKVYCILRWNVVPGYEQSYAQVILSLSDISDRKRAEEGQARYAERLRSLSSRLAEAEEAEKRRISRELHDKLGQRLTALGINLHILGQIVTPEQDTGYGQRIGDSLGLIEEMTEQVRDVMADLRPPVLDDYGLSAALRWYGDIFARRTGILIEIAGPELPRFFSAVEMALFRVVQEALTNVAKHSGAAEVVVAGAVLDGERLWVEVRDNGKGFLVEEAEDADMGQGWGLLSMRERVEALGGTLSVASSPGRGTVLRVEVRI